MNSPAPAPSACLIARVDRLARRLRTLYDVTRLWNWIDHQPAPEPLWNALLIACPWAFDRTDDVNSIRFEYDRNQTLGKRTMSTSARPRTVTVTLGEIIDGQDPRSDNNWYDLIEVDIPGHAKAMENGEEDGFEEASRLEAEYLNQHINDVYEVRWPEHVIGRKYNGDASYTLVDTAVKSDAINTAPAGWFVLTPEGCGWIAIKIGHNGQVASVVEESNASTHVAARDRFASIVEQIEAGNVNGYVETHEVKTVLDAWNEFSDSELTEDQVSVERIDEA